jgi:selenide,water dikinase
VVRDLPGFDDPDLLIGPDSFSDAGVYRIAPDLALVQTCDFFPPIVDDPFTYGQIAATNALSDVYAMGARPKTALNIVGFPDKELDLAILTEILRGGADRVRAAGAVIVGGHSVRDTEIKYGLAVTGIVDPARMLTNAGARAGDALVLTKGLGTGLIATANRAERCPPQTLAAACASMIALNDAAARAALDLGASAATDVTGFGLAGHALEMAEASGVTLEFELARLPVLPGALNLATPENHSAATKTNRAHAADRIELPRADAGARAELLFDPQTSGGLLIAMAPDRAGELVARIGPPAAVVGRVTARAGRPLVVRE